MTSLTYVFHNFIIIYHPFCFRKRVEIFFPFMFLVTFSVIYFNLHFPITGGGGGGVTVFFLTAWGELLFFSITVNGELKIFFLHLKISPAPPPPPPPLCHTL